MIEPKAAPPPKLASKLRALCVDVDGVLTDGGIYWDDEGHGLRRFHVHDGFAMRWFQRLGGVVIICSGKRSEAVAARMQELGIPDVIQGSTDKLSDVTAVLHEHGLTLKQTAVMGDDLPDVPLMRRAGLAVAVANAAPEVRAAAQLVTQRAGGAGAVREVVEHILRESGDWERVLALYGLNGTSAEAAGG